MAIAFALAPAAAGAQAGPEPAQPSPSAHQQPRPATGTTAAHQRRDVRGSRSAPIASAELPRSTETAKTGAADPPVRGSDGTSDVRLALQIGMLVVFLYLVFLAVWFSLSHRLRAVGVREAVQSALRRARGPRGQRVGMQQPPAPPHLVVSVPMRTPAPPSARWTCEIVWCPGRVRLQAVMARHDGIARHVIAETKRLPWPPKDPHRPPTRELVAAHTLLLASIEAAGWQPVRSSGRTWLERRFVWPRDDEPPSPVELLGYVPDEVEAPARPPQLAADRSAAPDRRAPRGANRRAVLRVVADRPGIGAHLLIAASGVKPDSRPQPAVRTEFRSANDRAERDTVREEG